MSSILGDKFFYQGIGGLGLVLVSSTSEALPQYNKYCNHSPDGFNWGYGGSGPCQLAFAMLYDYTGNLEWTKKHYIKFKDEVISYLPFEQDFIITGDELDAWITKIGEPV